MESCSHSGDRICCSGPRCSPNAAWGWRQRRAGTQRFFPALSLARCTAKPPQKKKKKKPFTSCPVLIGRAIWVVVVFPERLCSSFNCQTQLFGKLLKPNFLCDGANSLVAHNCSNLLVMACTNVFYTLVTRNQTVWSHISSNCADNSHEAQLVMLL